MAWKSGVSSCTFFLAFFFVCLCYHLALFLFAFTVAHFSLSFILFYDISLSSAGLVSVICHPTMLLQQLKRSVNFNISWLQASFKQNKITGLCWLSYYTITVQEKKKADVTPGPRNTDEGTAPIHSGKKSPSCLNIDILPLLVMGCREQVLLSSVHLFAQVGKFRIQGHPF